MKQLLFSRWWLIGFLVLAAIQVGVAVSRLSRAEGLVSYDGPGVTVMSWELVVGAVQSLVWALALAVVAVLPAAWSALADRAAQPAREAALQH